MTNEQKQLIREKWQEFCSKNPHDNKGFLMIQGVDIASDFWLNEIDLAIKQTEERIVREIQEKHGDHVGDAGTVVDQIITLIKNK